MDNDTKINMLRTIIGTILKIFLVLSAEGIKILHYYEDNLSCMVKIIRFQCSWSQITPRECPLTSSML